MQIYLAKPGGDKKGPYTLEQINRDLAARIYRDDAYWAWHEGLPEWVPLHALPGICIGGVKKAGPSLPPVPVVKPPKPGEHLIKRVTSATPITESTTTNIPVEPERPMIYKPLTADLTSKNVVAAPAASATGEPDVFFKKPEPTKESVTKTLMAMKPEDLLAHVQAAPAPAPVAKKDPAPAPAPVKPAEPEVFFKRTPEAKPGTEITATTSFSSKPELVAAAAPAAVEAVAKNHAVTTPVALAEPDVFFKRPDPAAAKETPAPGLIAPRPEPSKAPAPVALAVPPVAPAPVPAPAVVPAPAIVAGPAILPGVTVPAPKMAPAAPPAPEPKAVSLTPVSMPDEPDIFFKRAPKAPAAPAPAPVTPAVELKKPEPKPEVVQPKPEPARPKLEVALPKTEVAQPKLEVVAKAAAPAPAAPVAPAPTPVTPAPKAREEEREVFLQTPAPAAAAPATDAKPAAGKPVAATNLPFNTLEQIFVFTTGKGRPLFESAVFKQKILAIVGEPLNVIRAKVPVDVIGHMDLRVEETMEEGTIPDQALRTMSMVRPFVAGRAKEGLYQVFIRVLLAETNDVVTLFLFYNKQKKK